MKAIAIKAAKLAGKVMLDYYGNIGRISFKENKKSIVTQADLKAERVIIKTISQKFPDHNFLGEESGKKNRNSEYTWIIDPIDGTTNFTQQFPYFCTSIGLAKNDEIILGVVYDPLRKELFYAEKGKGAFLNNKRIKVSNKRHLNEAIIASGIPSSSNISTDTLHKTAKLFSSLRSVRITGSAALNLCSVACGRIDVYISQSIKSWDAAAGFIIIKEAHGRVTDLNDNEWNLKSKPILATNRWLHDKFLRVFKKR